MFAYPSPICPQTHQRCTLFCCHPDCNLPAFACSQQCRAFHHHQQYRYWQSLEPHIFQLLQTPFPKQTLLAMQHQDKQLQILLEELKALQRSHGRQMRECKDRLQVKRICEKVRSAVVGRKTEEVTGGEMAKFVRVLEQGEEGGKGMYLNMGEVEEAMSGRLQTFTDMLQELHHIFFIHKAKFQSLPKPQQIPHLIEQNKLQITLDLNTSNFESILINNGQITVKQMNIGKWLYYPIFAKQPLEQSQCFKIKVVDAAQHSFTVGVALDYLKDSSEKYRSKHSICFHAKGYSYCDGVRQQTGVRFETNDVITIRRKDGRIGCGVEGKGVVGEVEMPVGMLGRVFPVCWIVRRNQGKWISRLRFV